jgi:hypothetical protein
VERIPDGHRVGRPILDRDPFGGPGQCRDPDTVSCKTARMFAAGSTAITRHPMAANRRESWPVPAARSITVDPGSRPARSAVHATASGAYAGRNFS